MGIDFSHCNASWSYSGFHRFRCRLAEVVHLTLEDYNGYGEKKDWPTSEEEPLVSLFNHSDCEGELTPEECRLIAPRLREVMSNWADDYDRRMGMDLAQGMENAANANEPLEFY